MAIEGKVLALLTEMAKDYVELYAKIRKAQCEIDNDKYRKGLMREAEDLEEREATTFKTLSAIGHSESDLKTAYHKLIAGG